MNPIDQLEEQMEEASREYLATGEIPDALLQCFNHDGKWLYDTAASEFVLTHAQIRLWDLTIPASRCVTTNEKGESILLTSYMEKLDANVTSITLPWHEIRGMCVVETQGNLSCPNLRRLNPLYSEVEMSGLTIRLPELTEVHSLTLDAAHISVPKLEKAQYLAFASTRHTEAPALHTVGQLQLGTAFSALFAVLREVAGPLVGYSAREFSAPLLEAVNPGAQAHDGLVLPEAWTIDTPSLKYVGKRLVSWTAETFYPKDLKVEGTWEMHPRMKARLAMRGPAVEL